MIQSHKTSAHGIRFWMFTCTVGTIHNLSVRSTPDTIMQHKERFYNTRMLFVNPIRYQLESDPDVDQLPNAPTRIHIRYIRCHGIRNMPPHGIRPDPMTNPTAGMSLPSPNVAQQKHCRPGARRISSNTRPGKKYNAQP